ncbi:serine/threonine-protein phosphatase 6 regulatory subunit 3-B-like isoform X2 [Galleria mellonella]|uniref:Serine/threonine-protein phosphatase 6 regulatory subunit 3-B-like isoform X2 n=1 Tax=Galleria mellonella TaxID=7137 RepID=A0ABM3MDC2_GALME|nr:serine/threonine-protein phosphatase 6 regulatory subunit 3-B-like isoform X2 [Galleria mellonella]
MMQIMKKTRYRINWHLQDTCNLNVQVLEADDILQECKADNRNLMLFITKPEILAELITLITEEPPDSVELTAQYRYTSIAC